MLAIINKHLRAGDEHLAEAKYIVDCNADLVSSQDRAKFARSYSGLLSTRESILAKSGGTFARMTLVPSASEFKHGAKSLHEFAQRLADEAFEIRNDGMNALYFSYEENQSARINRSLLEEGYSCTPHANYTYEDVGYDKVSSADASYVVGLNPRRNADRRKSYRH